MNAAAGWFDDPGNGGQFRWWDGSRWTEHVRPKPPAAGWFDDPGNTGQLRWWDGNQWTDHVQTKSGLAAPTDRTGVLSDVAARVDRASGLLRRKNTEPELDANAGTRLRFAKGDFEFDIVGMHYRWEAVCKVAGKCPKDDLERTRNLTLHMRRDPDNEHDPNAIAVHHDKHGQIGFVPRQIAEQLAPALDKASRKLPKPVTWLFTAEMTAEWDDEDTDEPVDVSFRAMIDDQFRAKPTK
jgi:hypothetical protein